MSTPGLGDEVGVRAVGRDPVTVRAPRFDSEGQEVGQSELAVHRNRWSIEKMEFLNRRGAMAEVFQNVAVSATGGVKQFPELDGSYLQLQRARAGAEERIIDREAREQSVNNFAGTFGENPGERAGAGGGAAESEKRARAGEREESRLTTDALTIGWPRHAPPLGGLACQLGAVA
jgi:hypothetical protein